MALTVKSVFIVKKCSSVKVSSNTFSLEFGLLLGEVSKIVNTIEGKNIDWTVGANSSENLDKLIASSSSLSLCKVS